MENYQQFMILLEKISFTDKYLSISNKFSDYKSGMLNYSLELAKNYIEKKGYVTTFNKREHFFQIKEKINGINFILNICFDYSRVEFILSIVKNKVQLSPTGPFGLIAGSLRDNKFIHNPTFKNYEELEEILSKGLEIYEEIKKELLKASWY